MPGSEVQRSAKSENMAKPKYIIDVDTGVDDAQAIMMALSQNVDVLAITCVAGNVNVEQVLINTLRVLEACDRLDVPVYKGAVKSLLGSFEDSTYHHGEDGMGSQPDPNPPSIDLIRPEPAALAMIDIVNKYPGEVTLVALAPLTNVALAQRLHPEFGSKLKNMVIMGGNIRARGNTPNRRTTTAEFNFAQDAEAASITLAEIGCRINLLSWEVCSAAKIDWDWFDKLMAVENKKGNFHRRINEYTTERRKKVLKLPAYISCDPAAMAVALDPSIILEQEEQYCTVELHGELTRGQMVVDWNKLLNKDPNVGIVNKVDLEKLKLLYENMLK